MTAPPTNTALQDALALHRQGKHELAMQRYVSVLQTDPKNLDALYYVAVLAIQQGQLEEGLKVIARGLDIGPAQARLHNLRGQTQLRLNKDQDALASFGAAIECDPGFVDAYGNRGTLLAEMGRPAQALADFDRALALRPNNAEDVSNRAGVLADLGRTDEALMAYSRAIGLNPNFPPNYFNRAGVLVKMGQITDALANYDQVIRLAPNMPQAHNNRGLTLKEMGRLEDAKASIEQALALKPDYPEAITNRANIAFQQGRYDDAQADFTRALELQPEMAEANHGRGLASLTQGDWETGFRLYEYRGKLKEPTFKPLPYPRWDGKVESGEEVVLVTEQGLGDAIQFARFAPEIAKRGAKVTLLAPQPLHRLLSTLENVTLATPDRAPAVNGHPVRWLPLMSAPGVLGARPDAMPGTVPYLAAEPARVEHYAATLGSDGFRIGINWGIGTVPNWFSRQRDIPLSAFAPLADIAGVRLISLQKGQAIEQLSRCAFRDKIETVDADMVPDRDLFVDTAALMMNLDLVVTCDTSVTHLAGALGRPVFVALPHVSDWRWLRGREDTPWYPTARLFRQSKAGDWPGVFARIADAVRAAVTTR